MTENELKASLKSNFGFDDFRNGQLDIIQQLMQGRSALAVFPTGSGKSMCYQLPALHFNGLTLVVSPLIALMKDQVDFLCSKGLAAAKLDSTLSQDELYALWDSIESRQLKMLFIAPERIANEKFFQRIKKVEISMMVIDEAHCMSEWGHNFRPDYLKLRDFAEALGVGRVLNLTATATPKVSADICRSFEINKEAYVNTGFYRPNLQIHSTPCESAAKKKTLLIERLNSRPAGATVIYVTLQKQAEDLAQDLAVLGFPSMAYHAGLKNDDRHSIQETFMASDKAIVVATIAFGMGIDKANIRYVYHFNLPKSMENYSQEIGRAGRDGSPSICEIFSCDQDRIVLENFTYGDTPTEERLLAVVSKFLTQESFDVSSYHVSIESDIRPLVLSTMFCYLELDEIIKSVGHFYNSIKFKPKMSSAQMLSRFDPQRQAFLKSIFKHAKKGRIWLSLSISDTEAATNYPRAKITSAFNYLDEQGLLDMQVSEFLKNYRVLKTDINLNELAHSLFLRFQEAEKRDIERIHSFTQFTRSQNCLVQAMLGYFGEEKGPCGHCDRCLKTYSGVDVPLVRAELSQSEQQTLSTVVSEGHVALKTARQLAKFLCGITSPASSRSRPSLSKHGSFGVMGHLPFASILKSCESFKNV